MGVNLDFLCIFFDEAKRRPLTGKVLQLGRLAIDVTRDELVKSAAYYDHKLTECPDEPLIPYQFGPQKLVLNDQEFFKKLGFDSVDALDFDTREGNNVVFNLNDPTVPQDLVGQYDFIVNGGTLEHVFHLPNALNSLNSMLKPDGRIIHIAPASNSVEHGFYCFSPCLFIDYYEHNGYQVTDVSLIKKDLRVDSAQAEILKLYPEHASLLGYLMRLGSLDDLPHLVVAVVQKTPSSTGDKIPMQGYYQNKTHCACKNTPAVRTMPDGKMQFPWQKVVTF